MSKKKPCTACKKKGAAPCPACQIQPSPAAEERHEVIAEEKHEVIAEATACKAKGGAKGQCLPWVRIEKDPVRFAACLAEARKLGQITSAKQIVKLLGDYLERQDQEVFIVVLLDTQLYIRGVTELARAERDRTAAPIPDMLRVAIVDGAMAFVVLHNHPSGNCKPSKADIELTAAISKAAQLVDILLLDHIVMGSGEYFSFKEHNILPKLKKDDG